ncbi:hypothetical protein [Streptomyces inhibens]|uniref:hypothetical protein n=1 Tax=Streptomyces inhibens TaxID=2293571 RepID=UPI0015F26098|nr:hypothetical protein [Streptomyces inhibens]
MEDSTLFSLSVVVSFQTDFTGGVLGVGAPEAVVGRLPVGRSAVALEAVGDPDVTGQLRVLQVVAEFLALDTPLPVT